MTDPIWRPSAQRIAESNLQQFLNAHADQLASRNYSGLYEWSITKPEAFGGMGLDWSYDLAFCEAMGETNCGSIPMAVGVESLNVAMATGPMLYQLTGAGKK